MFTNDLFFAVSIKLGFQITICYLALTLHFFKLY